jgi:hypothetical protein
MKCRGFKWLEICSISRDIQLNRSLILLDFLCVDLSSAILVYARHWAFLGNIDIGQPMPKILGMPNAAQYIGYFTIFAQYQSAKSLGKTISIRQRHISRQ